MDCSPPSSVHGIFQARILEWIAISSFSGSSQPRDQTHVSCGSCIASRVFTAEPPGKPRQKLLLQRITAVCSHAVSCLNDVLYFFAPSALWLPQPPSTRLPTHGKEQKSQTRSGGVSTRSRVSVENWLCTQPCTLVFSCVWLFGTPWTVARQAPLSMGFSRQEYWRGLPPPPPGDLPDQGSNSSLLLLLH